METAQQSTKTAVKTPRRRKAVKFTSPPAPKKQQRPKKIPECHLRDPTLPPIRIKRKSVLAKTTRAAPPPHREYHHFSRTSNHFVTPLREKSTLSNKATTEHSTMDDDHIATLENGIDDDEDKRTEVNEGKSVLSHQSKTERMCEKRLNLMRMKASQQKHKSFDNVIALPI